MSVTDRVRWDKIYQRRTKQSYPAPDPLLLQYTPAVKIQEEDDAPRAVDLAAGVGQNGLWLARQGYLTDVMDISRVALNRARTEMTIANLRNVNLLQVDIDSYDFPEATYDLVCVFRYLRRELFETIRHTVKPGGRVIYATFNMRYLEEVPEFNRDFLLNVGELADFFPGWQHLLVENIGHESRLVTIKPG